MAPLRGIRVLDLSRLLPGPFCSWYLRGMGAEVVKVEDPQGGDYLRHLPPFDAAGVGVWFGALNAGARSVCLDPRLPGDREALLGLIAGADVLIEGFRPGVMARLGLAPASLLERWPRLVVASISGFGQDGPLREHPGHDLGYVGLTGAFALPVRHEGVPDVPAVQVADLAGGALTAALRVTAALYERERSGRGAWLDVSMTDGALALLAPVLAAAAVGEPPRPGEGPLAGGLAVYRLYRCADDRLLAVAAIEGKFQAELSRLLGPDVPLDEAGLRAAFATAPRDQWAEKLASACCTPVLDLEEALAHPLFRARGLVHGEGAARRVSPPWPGAHQFTGGAVPALGEHTAAELGALRSPPPGPPPILLSPAGTVEPR